MARARDYGAEALETALRTDSKVHRLEERLAAVEADLKRIVPLLEPGPQRRKMHPEIALINKRRAMSEAMKSRWKNHIKASSKKTPPPEPAPKKKRRRKKKRPPA